MQINAKDFINKEAKIIDGSIDWNSKLIVWNLSKQRASAYCLDIVIKVIKTELAVAYQLSSLVKSAY